jgi:hypothetical protein
MEAQPSRDLNDIERAIQAFNAGADPTAEGLMRAILGGQLIVLSAHELDPDHSDRWAFMVFGEGDASLLAAYTDAAEIPADIGQSHPYALHTSGESVARMAAHLGLVVNANSTTGLGVTVQAPGVQQLRDLADRAAAPAAARDAREPNALEQALSRIDLAETTNVALGELGWQLWMSRLFIPSSRPLDGPLDLDACYSYGGDDARLLAVFTAEDQIGDFAAAHLTELTGRELFYRLPVGVGLMVNPQRPDQKAIPGEALRFMGILSERRVADGMIAQRETTALEQVLIAAGSATPPEDAATQAIQAFWKSDLWLVANQPFGDPFTVDAALTFTADGVHEYAVFTDRDQIGDFIRAWPYLAKVPATDFLAVTPAGSGVVINPNRGVGGQLRPHIIDHAREVILESTRAAIAAHLEAGDPQQQPTASPAEPEQPKHGLRGIFRR